MGPIGILCTQYLDVDSGEVRELEHLEYVAAPLHNRLSGFPALVTASRSSNTADSSSLVAIKICCTNLKAQWLMTDRAHVGVFSVKNI